MKNARSKGPPDEPPIAAPGCTLDIEGEDRQRLVRMFKALGNPVRFEILKFLLTHPGCITADIVGELPIAQATVSQHLKVLKEAGWIEAQLAGSATRYRLRAADVRWFRVRVAEIF